MFIQVFMYFLATSILSVNIHVDTSSKKGLFPLLMRVLWVSPQTCAFTTGFMLFPHNWRPSMIRTRILIVEEKSDHLQITCRCLIVPWKERNWSRTNIKWRGSHCTWKSCGLLDKGCCFLVLHWDFWPGWAGDGRPPVSVVSSSPSAQEQKHVFLSLH